MSKRKGAGLYEGDPVRDPRFLAAIDLLRRTGAQWVQIRYSDDEQPVIWMVAASWDHALARGEDAGAGMSPLQASMRLLDQIVDGGQCRHCERPTGVTDDWRGEMPLAEHVCWYRYDPETESFRRSCEGETEPIGKVPRRVD